MQHSRQLFNNIKQCESCRRPLPNEYLDDLCPRCIEIKLFHDVKDFIRENDVNEYEVADHFNIPLRQVKEWIREGRIEYKETVSTNSIAGLHCQNCGAPVAFGTLCPKCLKARNGRKGYDMSHNNNSTDDNKMRYLDDNRK